MQSGRVVSKSDAKNYGFIVDSKNVSYFFHYSCLDKEFNGTVTIGEIVKFESVPGPKGMKAINISKMPDKYKYYSFPEYILISKTMEIKKYKELYLSHVFSASSEDISEPLEMLKSQAYEFGCNAILCLEYKKKSVTNNLRYYYSLHTRIGRLALFGKEEFTDDLSIVEKHNKELEERIKYIQECESLNKENIREPFKWPVYTIPVLIIAILVFFIIATISITK